MITKLVDPILNLHGFPAYAIVALLTFGEAAFLLGFVLPGETAVILGGVLAYRDHVSLPAIVVVATVAAIAGDSVGYEVGRLFGPRLLALRPLRKRAHQVERAKAFLRRRGGVGVFVGRFTAFFRATVPGLAGMAGMPYKRFLIANAAGGIVWAVGFTLLGYFVGSAYKRLESVSGIASAVLLGVVVVALVGVRVRTHVRDRRAERADTANVSSAPGSPADHDDDGDDGDGGRGAS